MFYYEPKDEGWFENNYCPTCVKKLINCLCDTEWDD